ncbi:MAG: DUF6702 family protein [Bacteroidota bacterium]
MRVLLLFIVFLSIQETSAHEFKIGHFEIRPNGENITLFVRLDRYDVLEVTKTQSGCTDYNNLDVCLTEYLVEHFKLNFDGVEACFEYKQHEIKKEFIEVLFRIGVSPEGVKNISVFNDVLLQQYSRQENIVYSLLNDKRRSFRLNRNRIETVIAY